MPWDIEKNYFQSASFKSLRSYNRLLSWNLNFAPCIGQDLPWKCNSPLEWRLARGWRDVPCGRPTHDGDVQVGEGVVPPHDAGDGDALGREALQLLYRPTPPPLTSLGERERGREILMLLSLSSGRCQGRICGLRFSLGLSSPLVSSSPY